jgi:lipopolysaccharide transport system ATP-binding protein
MSFEAAARRETAPARALAQVALAVRNVSKCFNVYERPHHRLLQGICRGRRRYFREFWSLRDIDLDVRRGEVVGIIGRNGSGKSTLLQVISGTLAPTAGSVAVHGRLAALLELGAGFNPEFTGRENVAMSGAILGLDASEVRARFEEIAAFADIGAFIDRPVRTYSSGMYVRLAFAVAACVEPDVLVVDEALAVGDAKFQAKCFRRFDQLTARGTTVVLVTHALDLVTRCCSRAVLLDGGRLRFDGAPKDAVNAYLDLVFGAARAGALDAAAPEMPPGPRIGVHGMAWDAAGFSGRPGYSPHEFRWGSGEAQIVDFAVTTDGTSRTAALATGRPMLVVIWVRFHRSVQMPIYGLTIKTPDGTTVFGGNSRDRGRPLLRPAAAGDVVEVAFRVDQALGAGDYLLSVGVAEQRGAEVIPLDRRYDAIHVTVDDPKGGTFGLAAFDMDVEIHAHALRA